MKFLHPEFLYALFALAIPIIIHLFNFRRYKRVAFTNVGFLREVRDRTQATQKVKHLLVLLSRLLLLAFLIMAFAQPVIPKKDAATARAEKAVSIFVDNSFSMQAENEEGNLLLQALEKARSVAQSYSPTAEFQLLTHGFEGKHQRFTTREDFLDQLDDIDITAQSRKLSEITSRQQDLLKTADGKAQHAYIISDFQQYMCDFEAVPSDTSIQVQYIPIGIQSSANVYIDSLWFNTPFHNLNQQEKLNIRIQNHSEKSAEDLPMNVWLDGAQASVGTYHTTPRNHTDTALYFNNDDPGIRHGYVDIDDYPITYDDQYYFTYSVDSTLKVLEITGENLESNQSYFSRIFGDDPLYEYNQVSVRMIDYSDLKNSHFIVLNELDALSSGLRNALYDFVENGGSVFLVPGASIDGTSLNEFTQLFQGPAFTEVVETDSKVGDIDTEAPFFANLFERIPRNMDLPKVLSHYRLTSKVTGKDRALMRLQNGNPFLSHVSHGLGNLYISAVPLVTENNNFARHAIFVASVLRMSELSRPSTAISYSLASELAISTGNHLPSGDDVFNIKSVEGDFEFIPEFNLIDGKGFLFIRDQISEAGNYVLQLGGRDLMGLAFNYPRSESVLDYYSGTNLRNALDEYGLTGVSLIEKSGDALEASLMDMESGKKLWKIFLIIALLFVLIETLLLKFWK